MKITNALVSCLALTLLATSPVQSNGQPGWTTDLKQAIAQSKATGRPILANFTGSDWCGYCIKQEKEVFASKPFQAWAQQNAILLTVDFPRSKSQPAAEKKQNEQLKAQFKPSGFPTLIFMDAKGSELGRVVGYGGGGFDAWVKRAQPLVDKAKTSS